ncbi:MAG: hypothetical protein ACFFF9_00315 [Candidatus Thorarchaeota archaeon]
MASPNIQVLLDLRTKLEEEIDRLRESIDRLEEFIQVLDVTIGKASFVTADTALGMPEQSPELTPTEEIETTGEPRSILVMNKAGDLELATIEVIDQNLRIVPADHAVYNITRGAFAKFFLKEILGKFQEEDRLRAENKEIDWDDTFDFELKSEDNNLDEILITNYGPESRLEEIQRTLRWALDKIYRPR